MTGPIGMRVLSVRVDQGGRRVEQPKWEWMDSLFGMILGAISAIVGLTGWINRKFEQMRTKHDADIVALYERVTPLAEDVSALMAHHESDRERLQSIDKKLDRIEEFLREWNRRTP